MSPPGFEQFLQKAETVFGPGGNRDDLPRLGERHQVRLEWWDWAMELKKCNLRLLGD